MNYYDEEISIGASEPNSLNNSNLEASSTDRSSRKVADRKVSISSSHKTKPGRRKLNMQNSTDDDGLLQNILDRDEDDDDDDDDDEDDDDEDDDADSFALKAPAINKAQSPPLRLQPHPRTSTRSSSSRQKPLLEKLLQENTNDEVSGTESDEEHDQPSEAKHTHSGRSYANTTNELQFNIMPEKWESLHLPKEIKNLFPYILKYTPQNFEIPYQLKPFIPDYVPAVGDVDAFLKVSVPPLFKPDRQEEVNENISRMGLYCLDEPSGEQTDPSLLNIKLRSVLSGSGATRRSASAQLVPIAKSSKDIDKWIAEVEQLHMTHSVFDAQPNKDMEALLISWPRSFADAKGALINAYQNAVQGDLNLIDYVRFLCEKFEVDGTFETQMDYVNHVHSLFALYLAANQAWD